MRKEYEEMNNKIGHMKQVMQRYDKYMLHVDQIQIIDNLHIQILGLEAENEVFKEENKQMKDELKHHKE